MHSKKILAYLTSWGVINLIHPAHQECTTKGINKTLLENILDFCTEFSTSSSVENGLAM